MIHILLAAAICASAFAVVPCPATTKIVKYNASQMKGKPVSGSCWTTSNASMRRDAYRCMLGNSIMDPCFAVSAKMVNCPENLDTNTGTTIRLTKPLPKHSVALGHLEPWRMQLFGGIPCNRGTGTIVDDSPYYCARNLVCTTPKVSAQSTTAYEARCGKPAGPVTVKDVTTMFVTQMWE